MTDAKREAVLLAFAAQLKSHGSWCGETHWQKSIYFLQEFADVPLGLEYVLYKHGPYSFDLNDQLTAMRANGLVELKVEPPYGPHLLPSDRASELVARFPRTRGIYAKRMEFLATRLGDKKVGQLERLATALYAEKRWTEKDSVWLAKKIHELKPHVSVAHALEALADVESFRSEWVSEQSDK